MKTIDVRWPAVALAALALVAAPATRAQDETADEVEYALVKPLAAKSLLLDAVAVDGLMVAVGDRGHVLLSDDDGESWRQASSVPTRATLTGVWFHDRQLGWAVGHDAVILRTRDGGDTWERLHWAPEEERPFLDVWFRDAENGFAIGAYGFFLVTADGGDTWEDLGINVVESEEEEEEVDLYDLGGDFHLNHIASAGDGRLYIAAEAGTIYRSDDGGETWRELPSPYEGSFFATLPLDGDSLLLFGLRGNLFRSDDAGETWRAIETGTVAILNAGRRLADGTIVIAGTAGALLVSRDGGETVSLVERPDRQALATVLEAGDGLILIGEFGANKIPLAEL
jgi:photosystem II stability/assembly factor-like uncharacterized protein